MQSRRHGFVAALAILAILAGTSVLPAAVGASEVPSESEHAGVSFTWFVADAGAPDVPVVNATRGDSLVYTVILAANATAALTNDSYTANVTFEFGPGFETPGPRVMAKSFTNVTNATFTIPFTVNASAIEAPVALGYSVNLSRVAADGNVTFLGEFAESSILEIVPVPGVVPPPTPVAPVNWPIVVGAGAAVVALGGGAYALYRRTSRPKVKPRSRVLQEMKLEQRMEKLEKRAEVSEDAREEIAEIKEQIRSVEKGRERNREVMILEAKRDDVLKQITLLEKRRDMGGLTELQFNKMVEKKKLALAEAERELAEMGTGDAGSA